MLSYAIIAMKVSNIVMQSTHQSDNKVGTTKGGNAGYRDSMT